LTNSSETQLSINIYITPNIYACNVNQICIVMANLVTL